MVSRSDNNLSPEEDRIAREEARAMLCRHPWLARKGYELDDLIQEAEIRWCLARDRYSPDHGATRQTFMKRVVRNCFRDIVREQLAEMRGSTLLPLSLDMPLHFDDTIETVGDAIPDDEAENAIRAIIEDHGRRQALDRAMSKLTEAQREICDLLQSEESISEMCRKLKRDRSAVYEARARIRKVFADEGLEDFVG